MLILALLVVLITLIVVSYKLDWDSDATYAFIVCSVIVVIVGGVGTFCLNNAQANYQNEILRLKEIQAISQLRIDNVLPSITGELGKYPEFERSLQRAVAGGSEKGQLIVVPPQLKSNETIVKAAEAIATYRNSIYNIQEKIVNAEYSFKFNARVGPWYFPLFVKNLP